MVIRNEQPIGEWPETWRVTHLPWSMVSDDLLLLLFIMITTHYLSMIHVASWTSCEYIWSSVHCDQAHQQGCALAFFLFCDIFVRAIDSGGNHCVGGEDYGSWESSYCCSSCFFTCWCHLIWSPCCYLDPKWALSSTIWRMMFAI